MTRPEPAVRTSPALETGAEGDDATGVLRGGIERLVFPKSAVLIGLSPDRLRPRLLAENASRPGTVTMMGISRNHAQVAGVPCVPRLEALDTIPDLAVLMVGPQHIESAFEEALALGIRSFLVPGLGAEAGAEGAAIARRLAAAADDAGAAMAGPNCMGIAVPDRPSLWIERLSPTFAAGGTAIVTQSGAVGVSLAALGPRIGFRCVISTGAEVNRDVADFCAFFAEDPGTRAVGVFLESIRRPAAFAQAATRMAVAGKPVVCLKVGRSAAAARMAMAHTGAVVGSAMAFAAFCQRYGIITVADEHEFVETLEVVGKARRRPSGRRVGVITSSGGEGSLFADLAERVSLELPDLSTHTDTEITRRLPGFHSSGNPLDIGGGTGGDGDFAALIDVIAEDPTVDVLVAQYDQSQFAGDLVRESEYSTQLIDALADAANRTGTFPVLLSSQVSDPPSAVAAHALDRDVSLLRGNRAAAAALAYSCRDPQTVPTAESWTPVALPMLDGMSGGLAEYESAQILAAYGVPFAAHRRLQASGDLAGGTRDLRWPLVAKADGPIHKQKMGGVRTGIDDIAQLRDALAALGGDGLVAEQIAAGDELLCGMFRDPQFGPVLVIGPGGQAAEASTPTVVMLAPIDTVRVQRDLEQLPFLQGAERAHTREHLSQILTALARLASDHPQIQAIDVNPVIIGRDGSAVGVDALVVIDETSDLAGDPSPNPSAATQAEGARPLAI